QMTTTVFLQATLDASYNLNSCYALGLADSLWQISPANMADIYYPSGNVGIGTAAPIDKFEVAGSITTSGTAAAVHASSGYFDYSAGVTRIASIGPNATTNGAISLDTYRSDGSNGIHSFFISSAGNVGIGTINPTAQLFVGSESFAIGTRSSGVFPNNFQLPGINVSMLGGSYVSAGDSTKTTFLGADVGSGEGMMGTFNNIGLGIRTNNIDRINIDTNGNVGIGIPNPSYQLQLSTDSAAKPGTSTWTIASDERLKDIRAPFDRGLASIEGIHPIYFNYKQGNPLDLPSEKEYVGIKAQDALKVVPEAVSQDDNGYYHITNDAIIWTVLNAVKELYHKWLDDSSLKDRQIALVIDKASKLEAENAQLKANDSAKDQKIHKLEQENAEIKTRLERIEKML
ncbi:MAG TPA: tail fiber domain-containing protein, partial [Pseudobdellovibrionaceae bacterium]